MLEFLRKLFAPRPSSKPKTKPKPSPKPRRFVEIVGESRYQDALSEIAGGKTYDGHVLPVRARLVPEDDNPYDPMAVRIEIQGRKVGYLTRYQARQFRKRSQGPVECRAKIVGGWDRGGGDTGHFGVELDLTL